MVDRGELLSLIEEDSKLVECSYDVSVFVCALSSRKTVSPSHVSPNMIKMMLLGDDGVPPGYRIVSHTLSLLDHSS